MGATKSMGVTTQRHTRPGTNSALHTCVDPFEYSIGTRVRDSIFLRMMSPVPGDRIVDVGCGLGHFTHVLAQVTSCTGVDIDDKCLGHCSNYLDGNYVKADIRVLPFPSQSFDKALCSEVLEHISDNGTVLDEIHRVLSPDGVLTASVPCSDGIFGGKFKNIGHSHVDENSLEYHHHKGYTLTQFSSLLAQHGFEVTEHEYTMVLFVEVIMMITKSAIHRLTGKRIRSQSDALPITRKWYWRVYCWFFPVALLIGKAEQPLSRSLRGHMLIVKARKCNK